MEEVVLDALFILRRAKKGMLGLEGRICGNKNLRSLLMEVVDLFLEINIGSHWNNQPLLLIVR